MQSADPSRNMMRCSVCSGSDVDSTKGRHQSKAPMRMVGCPRMRLGVLVPAECTADSLVDCLKECSFEVRRPVSSIFAIVTEYSYLMTFGRIA